MATKKPLVLFEPGFRAPEELFAPNSWRTFIQRFDVMEGAHLSPADRQQALRQMNVYIADRPSLNAVQVQQATDLRAIIEVAGAFHDDMDYAACLALGIEVLSCAPGFRRAVAEMALALILGLARGLIDEHEAFRLGTEAWLDDQPDRDFSLFGQKVGFIGYGHIARELHRLLEPFGVKALAYDPWLPDLPTSSPALVPLETVVSQSKILAVTAAPTEENQTILSADLIAQMPHNSLVLLISRAYCVDWAALTAAAARGHIRLATDVFPQEPLAQDDPVRTSTNVLLSPHRAAAVLGGRWPIGEMILHDLGCLFAGQPTRQLKAATADTISSLTKAQRRIEHGV